MTSLAHDLHILVALMDRRADTLLAEGGLDLSYRRFLTLVHVAEQGELTQRELAERVGSSEAATSRMVAGLEAAGLVSVKAGTGRRRLVTMTAIGEQQLTTASTILGDRFDQLVRSNGAVPEQWQSTVRSMIAELTGALR